MKSRVLLFLFIFAAVISIISNGQAQPSGYHLLKKFVLGGDGGWDVSAAGVWYQGPSLSAASVVRSFASASPPAVPLRSRSG